MKLINLAVLVSMLSFSAAFADNTAKPTAVAKKPTPEPTSTLAPVSSEPEATTAIFGDWSLHCTHVQASGKNIRFCEVLQSIELQGESRPVAQIAFGRVNPEGPLKLTAVLPELCGKVGDGADQAADLVSSTISIPLANFTPLIIFGN